MEEKKLTDEEIIKAIEKCFAFPMKCEDGCPYFNKHGRNFCVEENAFYKDLKRIVTEHAEQKAEIERLTEEIKSIKEMTAEQVIESEKLKQSCAEAVNSFVRLETLYKVKCKELELANKKLEEVKGGKTD